MKKVYVYQLGLDIWPLSFKFNLGLHSPQQKGCQKLSKHEMLQIHQRAR